MSEFENLYADLDVLDIKARRNALISIAEKFKDEGKLLNPAVVMQSIGNEIDDLYAHRPSLVLNKNDGYYKVSVWCGDQHWFYVLSGHRATIDFTNAIFDYVDRCHIEYGIFVKGKYYD